MARTHDLDRCSANHVSILFAHVDMTRSYDYAEPEEEVPMMIYKPKGRAAEYGSYAVSLFTGCPHGCHYCYVPGFLRITREEFQSRCAPRPGISEAITKEAPKLPQRTTIFLCFSCDPFPYSSWEMFQSPEEYSTDIIRTIKDAGHNVRLLTKGWVPKSALDLLDGEDEVGVTLTCQDPHSSELWEPGAASPDDRCCNLIRAHDREIRTWVSFEPVLDPASVYALIQRTERYVDRYAIGKSNHLPDWNWPSEQWRRRVESIDWPLFALSAANLCRKLGISCRLKDDLAVCLPRGMEHLRRWDNK